MGARGSPAEALEYHSFLLRLWQVQQDDRTVCRVLLENVDNGEKLGFEDLEALFAYLEGLVRPEPGGIGRWG